MLIAHISDFHVFSRAPETALVRSDAEQVARRVVADLAAFVPAIDAVCLTGDLTDGGSADDYALLTDILAPIACPIFVTPGNHDRRATMRAAFAHLPFSPAETLHYETSIGPVRILALDTLIEGQVQGRLDRTQLEWLGGRLATVVTDPTVIVMHHPPFASGIDSLDAMALVEGAGDLGEIVRAYPGALRILCGHIHRPYQALWNGAFCAVSGSPAFQIGLDLRYVGHEPGAVSEPFAYFIHRLDAADGLAVHTRYVTL